MTNHITAMSASNSRYLRQYLVYLSYFGNQYSGIVPTIAARKSVGNVLLDVLSKYLPTIKPYSLLVSSRTDKGVHAYFNTVRFLTNSPHSFKCNMLRCALNYDFLTSKEMIRVHQIKEIPTSVNIISGVTSRTYLYRIGVTKRSVIYMNCVTAWDANQVYMIGSPFSIERFHEAAVLLSGCYNFSGFTNINGLLDTKSPTKTVKIKVIESSPSVVNMSIHPFLLDSDMQYYDIFVTAESFMNKMVRFLVGCMIDVGFGLITLEDARAVLENGSHYLQTKPFRCAPPYALYLYKLGYHDESLNFDVEQLRSELEPTDKYSYADLQSLEIIADICEKSSSDNVETNLPLSANENSV